MTITRFCLVRHGETAWNAERRLQGQLDIPLNAVGVTQARAVANSLAQERFDALYSSDLIRAWHTAEAIGHVLHQRPRVEHSLRERHYGLFQDRTHEQIAARFPREYRLMQARDPDFVIPGGESLAAFARRVTDCLRELAARHARGQILLVTHGGVLDVVNRWARGLSLSAPRDFETPNAALNWVVIDSGRAAIESWAERGHLAGTMDDYGVA